MTTPLGHRPLLALSERTVGVLRRTAVAWALAAIVGLVVATWLALLDYRPGGDAYEIEQWRVFVIGFALAIVVSWWSQIIGGVVASIAAAAILVFSRNQLEPLDAAIVTVAFAVPGVLWIVIELHDLRPRAAIGSLVAIALAVGTGALLAQRAYDDVFGPTHPSSNLAALPDSDVAWIWSGGVTAVGATVVAELDVDDARASASRLIVSRDPSFGGPRLDFPGDEVGDGVVRFVADGLVADTQYHYAVEIDGELRAEAAGAFRSMPSGPASFTLAFGSCARTGSNGAVFDAIRTHRPSMFVVTGDFHYANIGDADEDAFLAMYREQLTPTAPAALFRSTPVAYVWDDHDFGADNADATSPSRPAATAAYRRAVPHYPLAGVDQPIHQAFTVGRARVIMTDTRSGRSPATDADDTDATMLGAGQQAWLERELLAADGEFPLILWVNSVPWIAEPAAGRDDWGGYATERREIADFIAEHDIDGVVMLSGDAHMVALDDGSNSDYSTEGGGGFPVLHGAALDRPGSVKGGPYSHGAFPGSGQFGLVEVFDDGGTELRVTLSGRTWEDDVLVSHELTVPVEG